jgi:hypothetical protein
MKKILLLIVTFFSIIVLSYAQSFNAVQTNPYSLTELPMGYSAPAFADLDGDGDPDMMSGDYDGNFYYFRNDGTASSPSFAAVQINPFSLIRQDWG